jgi:hypothetical protein
MESGQLEQVLAELRAELETAEAQVETLRAGIAAMELMQQRRGSMPLVETKVRPTATPSHETDIDPNAPRGSQAVEIILSEMPPGLWVPLSQLAGEFQKRGWGPESNRPREAVRTNANRLVKAKPDEYEGGRGKYRRRAPELSAPQPSSVFDAEGGGEDQEGLMGDRSAAQAV